MCFEIFFLCDFQILTNKINCKMLDVCSSSPLSSRSSWVLRRGSARAAPGPNAWSLRQQRVATSSVVEVGGLWGGSGGLKAICFSFFWVVFLGFINRFEMV